MIAWSVPQYQQLSLENNLNSLWYGNILDVSRMNHPLANYQKNIKLKLKN